MGTWELPLGDRRRAVGTVELRPHRSPVGDEQVVREPSDPDYPPGLEASLVLCENHEKY